MDVYRAYGSLMAGITTDAVPLTEASPVRVERYPNRGQHRDLDDYDKLDVEEVYLGLFLTLQSSGPQRRAPRRPKRLDRRRAS